MCARINKYTVARGGSVPKRSCRACARAARTYRRDRFYDYKTGDEAIGSRSRIRFVRGGRDCGGTENARSPIVTGRQPCVRDAVFTRKLPCSFRVHVSCT